MTPREVFLSAVIPGLDLLHGLGGPARTDCAEVMLLAIAGQESAWTYREQHSGPARGLWQFERGGGVAGVLSHHASHLLACDLCAERGVEPAPRLVHERLATDDLLAAGFARLLLLTDPLPLPAVGDQHAAWMTYLKNWRPGKPHPQRWPANYASALAAL